MIETEDTQDNRKQVLSKSVLASTTGATPNSINVFVRVKPLSESERGMDKNKQWQIINDDKCILHKYTREMFTFGKNDMVNYPYRQSFRRGHIN